MRGCLHLSHFDYYIIPSLLFFVVDAICGGISNYMRMVENFVALKYHLYLICCQFLTKSFSAKDRQSCQFWQRAWLSTTLMIFLEFEISYTNTRIILQCVYNRFDCHLYCRISYFYTLIIHDMCCRPQFTFLSNREPINREKEENSLHSFWIVWNW